MRLDRRIERLSIAGLARDSEQSLGSQCAWGPVRAGDALLLATDDNHLLCLDAQGKRRWQVSLEHGPLVGAPLPMGNGFVLASRNGVIFRVEAGTGKTLGKIDLQCPLGTGPAR